MSHRTLYLMPVPASCLLPVRGACESLTGARLAIAGLAALRNRVLHELKRTVPEAVPTSAPEPVGPVPAPVGPVPEPVGPVPEAVVT